ncbi:di-trans,poly-cis-decaprenylcistransferase [Candidatus Berkelbacteria bacterium]|nr:di-trans,poly-cis-decaprenylcistransferase [Candidatus Berkelbacteria bacterium]
MSQVVPTHVAIILDGNRRWARARGENASFGHKAGMANIDRIIDRCLARGIRYLTVWGFSTENWKRDAAEVEFLMQIFETRLREKGEDWHRRGVRIHHMGQLDRLPPTLQKVIRHWMTTTRENTALTVTLCLSYGGHDELIRAIQKLIQAGTSTEQITEEAVVGALDSAGIPNPDLVIRTSGEQRLSGFLSWQSAYSELYFTQMHWPDFDEAALDEAIAWYAARERRYGK